MRRAGVFSAVILTFGALGHLLAAEAGKRPSKLERCSCFQTEAIHEFDRIFLAGQPTPEGFAEAQKADVRTVVNLRAASELNWDEKAHVEGLGMKYIHVPISSSEAMTDEIFAQLRELLKDKSRRPILVHCFSAGRVGAAWLAHRILDDGLSLESAVEEAKTVGLRKEDYIRKATDYVQRMQAKVEQAARTTAPDAPPSPKQDTTKS